MTRLVAVAGLALFFVAGRGKGRGVSRGLVASPGASTA